MKFSFFSIFTVILFCVAYTLASHEKAPSCVMEESCMGSDWKLISPAMREERVKLVFVLRQKNLDAVEKIVKEVSNPKSEKYGQYLTFEEMGRLVYNHEAVQAVKSWLETNGVDPLLMSLTRNGEFLTARMSVETAEKLLSAHFSKFVSVVAKTSILRVTEYSLPKEMLPFVHHVDYTVHFPQTLRRGSISSVSTEAAGTTTISLLRSFYNITKSSTTSSATTQSLFESGQSFSPDDLATFQKQYDLESNAVDNVIGTNSPSICSIIVNECTEANLDVQYIMAVAQLANTTYWSVAESEENIFLEWIKAVADNSQPPLVHSISYGSIESELPSSGVESFNTEAMKLGARGVTIMVSSGDDGVANFVARSNKDKCGFNPSFPATAPYVTAVGATQGPEDNSDEIMCSSSTNGLITSGGGFSTVFDQPSYQESVVDSYLSNGPNLPPTSQFSSSGRAYPDVAAMGHNYLEVIGGKTYEVSGTSASSPVFAGMVSLINDLRLSAGKSSLGFLNTALYELGSTSSVFNDITSGTNNCCAGSRFTAVCCTYGFTASSGWDPTTGFGSVNWGLLANALYNN